MDVTTIMTATAMPPEMLGTLVQPAALFGAWSALVVVVLAGLATVLGVEDPTPRRTFTRLRALVRCDAAEQRAAA